MRDSSRGWTEWHPIPDPREREFLRAPFGPGVYEIHNRRTDEFILIGEGGHLASRMTSLLPAPLGAGTRHNSAKRDYLLENLADLEYRTLACDSKSEARLVESKRKKEQRYLFNT